MSEKGKSTVEPDSTPAYLTEVVVENLERLRHNETTPAAANAITNGVGSLLRHAKLQMDYAKATNSTPEIPLLSKA